MTKKLLATYVYFESRCFFVSTIERESSAAVSPPPRFAETMVWDFDCQSRERGDIVAQAGDGEAFRQHFGVCEQLFRTGKYQEGER